MVITFPNGKEGPIRVMGATFFVSKYMYWGSMLNSLHGLKFIKEVNLRTYLGLYIEDMYIYEFALQTANRNVVGGDYQLPTPLKGRNFYFDLHHVYFPHALNQIKKMIFEPPKRDFHMGNYSYHLKWTH